MPNWNGYLGKISLCLIKHFLKKSGDDRGDRLRFLAEVISLNYLNCLDICTDILIATINIRYCLSNPQAKCSSSMEENTRKNPCLCRGGWKSSPWPTYGLHVPCHPMRSVCSRWCVQIERIYKTGFILRNIILVLKHPFSHMHNFAAACRQTWLSSVYTL